MNEKFVALGWQPAIQPIANRRYDPGRITLHAIGRLNGCLMAVRFALPDIRERGQARRGRCCRCVEQARTLEHGEQSRGGGRSEK